MYTLPFQRSLANLKVAYDNRSLAERYASRNTLIT